MAIGISRYLVPGLVAALRRGLRQLGGHLVAVLAQQVEAGRAGVDVEPRHAERVVVVPQRGRAAGRSGTGTRPCRAATSDPALASASCLNCS